MTFHLGRSPLAIKVLVFRIGSHNSIDYDFDYDGNSQGGRSTADAEVVVMVIGEEVATWATANLTIERKTGNNISVVSALERNYENPV